MHCDSLGVRDWIYVTGVAVPILLFWWRLRADTRFATYRETVSYLDKRSSDLKALWSEINGGKATEEKISEFLGELDQVALLVLKKGFDSDLVYNLWWSHFNRPRKDSRVIRFLEKARRADSTVCENYIKLCELWEPQILNEQLKHNSPQ